MIGLREPEAHVTGKEEFHGTYWLGSSSRQDEGQDRRIVGVVVGQGSQLGQGANDLFLLCFSRT